MLIETERLVIRDVTEEDGPAFAEMAADGSLKDIGFDRDCGRWMAKWTAEARELAGLDRPDRAYLAYTAALKGEDTAIGSVGCSYYEDLQETGITYFIGSQYRNCGYAVEAVKAYLQYFFSRYRNRPRIVAVIRAENVPSWKTAEKAGFRLVERKLYQDLFDDQAAPYHFYECLRR